MDELFQKIIDHHFTDLKGLTAEASIPVPQRLINEFIQLALRGNKTIEYCVVTILEQNKILVNLKLPVWPWPFDLKLRLDWSLDLAIDPKITAALENNILLGRLGALFKALPKGIDIYGSHVVVDIGSFLTDPEQKIFLGLIKSAEIKTEPGTAIFDVKIRVD